MDYSKALQAKIDTFIDGEIAGGRSCSGLDIARYLKTSYRQILNWSKKHPDMRDCLARAEEETTALVENCLFEACLKGNLNAIAFYLKCRNPRWNPEKNQASAITVNMELSAEDKREIRRAGKIRESLDFRAPVLSPVPVSSLEPTVDGMAKP